MTLLRIGSGCSLHAGLLALLLAQCVIQVCQTAVLRAGKPLTWAASKPFLNQFRASAVDQFIQHYQRCRDVVSPQFLWGDEVEYGVFARDSSGHFDLLLSADELRQRLAAMEATLSHLPKGCEWHPEYGAWMVEAVPRDPFGGQLSDLLEVEKSLRLRRQRLHEVLPPSAIAPTLSTFPMLGVRGYGHTQPSHGAVAQSDLVSDRVINPHPRFASLTENIRMRRGERVSITIPSSASDRPISMDAMAFGMGCCCLQVTTQWRDEEESRYIYDQLAVLAPIFLALSAATPVAHGQLSGLDCRWDIISQAVDDRTPAERGELDGQDSPLSLQPDAQLAGKGILRLPHSRFSSAEAYLSAREADQDAVLHDCPVAVDPAVYAHLHTVVGLDSSLSRHVAHLCTRDPLLLFPSAPPASSAPSSSSASSSSLEDFVSLQSTDWRTVRWKPPDSSSPQSPGWRVEFRPMDLQLTDFENAAYAVAAVAIARSLAVSRRDLCLPWSLVLENMRRAQQKDAVGTQKFFFRRDALRSARESTPEGAARAKEMSMDIAEMSVAEILSTGMDAAQASGTGDLPFTGLLAQAWTFLGTGLGEGGEKHGDLARLQPYFDLLCARAEGRLPTTAQFLRSRVETHAEYTGDGHLTPRLADDLLVLAEEIGTGKRPAPELYGMRALMRAGCQPQEGSLLACKRRVEVGGERDEERGKGCGQGNSQTDGRSLPSLRWLWRCVANKLQKVCAGSAAE